MIESSKTAKNTGRLDLHLSFLARDPRGEHDGNPHLVDLGTRIDPGDPPFVTYYLAIGEKGDGDKYRGLRKFHFDIDFSSGSDEPKPAIHLQIPGRTWPELIASGFEVNAFEFLKPKCDKPRIPSLPTSLAILAHFALLEYVSADSSIGVFIKSSGWLSSVTSSERDILSTFMKHSLIWMEKATNKKQSLISHYYRYPSS